MAWFQHVYQERRGNNQIKVVMWNHNVARLLQGVLKLRGQAR
jgi:hypothetical protein